LLEKVNVIIDVLVRVAHGFVRVAKVLTKLPEEIQYKIGNRVKVISKCEIVVRYRCEIELTGEDLSLFHAVEIEEKVAVHIIGLMNKCKAWHFHFNSKVNIECDL